MHQGWTGFFRRPSAKCGCRARSRRRRRTLGIRAAGIVQVFYSTLPEQHGACMLADDAMLQVVLALAIVDEELHRSHSVIHNIIVGNEVGLDPVGYALRRGRFH